MGVIYKITNKFNFMVYIGKTARTLEIRMKEHLSETKTYIDRAIHKYGIDAFEVSVIEECATLEELNEREIFWIAFYNCKKPNGYNLTDGGEGIIGYKFSSELIEKRSKSRQGKKLSEKARKTLSDSQKGKTFSDEIRARMSNVKKNKCPVKCVETGLIFDSILAASNWSKTSRINIRRALDKSTSIAGGYHWCYVDSANPPVRNQRPVKCVETGEIFESMSAAAKSIGISSSGIKNVIIGKNHTAGGYHWEDAKVDVKAIIQKNSHPVKCVETGETFESIAAAAKYLNLLRGNIKCALNRSTRTAGGYHWCDADSKMDETAMTSAKDRLHAVKCVETGQIFESLATASKFANVHFSNIQRVLNKSSRTSGGYHWVDVDAE